MQRCNNIVLNKIKSYFNKDYSYLGIINRLNKKYNVQISLRTLTRLLRQIGLRRKCINESSEELIGLAIIIELEGSGLNLGYKSMLRRLRNIYNLIAKQKTVMRLMQLIDPQGVNDRCRYKLKRRMYKVPGPNFVWHADGHDKLKKYGFAVYGCIDGFSNKVLWLEVSTTNNDPQVIGYYFLNYIDKCGHLPTIIRTDNGTERLVLMEDFQKALRYMQEDEFSGENSFVRGKSTHNQRIEAYWRQFRQSMGDFYISLFKGVQHQIELTLQSS